MRRRADPLVGRLNRVKLFTGCNPEQAAPGPATIRCRNVNGWHRTRRVRTLCPRRASRLRMAMKSTTGRLGEEAQSGCDRGGRSPRARARGRRGGVVRSSIVLTIRSRRSPEQAEARKRRSTATRSRSTRRASSASPSSASRAPSNRNSPGRRSNSPSGRRSELSKRIRDGEKPSLYIDTTSAIGQVQPMRDRRDPHPPPSATTGSSSR